MNLKSVKPNKVIDNLQYSDQDIKYLKTVKKAFVYGKKELPVITDDLGLYHLLINSSIDCLNMNTIRMYSI